MGNAVHVQAWLLWSLFLTKPHGLALSTSLLTLLLAVPRAVNGACSVLSSKMYGLPIHFGFRTSETVKEAMFGTVFIPNVPCWVYESIWSVCKSASCLVTVQNASVREQRRSLQATSLEAFMGIIQGCFALENPLGFSERFHSFRSSMQCSVLNLTSLIHLTTISENIHILVRWA